LYILINNKDSFPGVQKPGVRLFTQPHLEPSLCMSGAILLIPTYAFKLCTETTLQFICSSTTTLIFRVSQRKLRN